MGRAASDEAAEAIALLLPWPDGAPTPASRPALVDWLADWAAAAALPRRARAAAVAATIAALDDAIARRWAVRAVCGLVKPVVDEWQWQRAWARAFDVEPQAVAWWWHRRRDALLHDAPPATRAAPAAFAPLPDAPDDARTASCSAAWRRGDLHAEPRWGGVRVHVVRRGDEVAVWQRGGRLLNARLPAALAGAGAVARGRRDRGGAAGLARRPRRRAGRGLAPRKRVAEPRPTLHLALVDWHGADGHAAARVARACSRAGPRPRSTPAAPPAIFTTPDLPPPDADATRAAALANAARAAGWSGLVLRRRAADAAWAVRAAVHRVRAVLQYVPGDALGAGAAAARRWRSSNAASRCGTAFRDPRRSSARAMTAAMSGEFLPPPADAPGVDGLAPAAAGPRGRSRCPTTSWCACTRGCAPTSACASARCTRWRRCWCSSSASPRRGPAGATRSARR